MRWRVVAQHSTLDSKIVKSLSTVIPAAVGTRCDDRAPVTGPVPTRREGGAAVSEPSVASSRRREVGSASARSLLLTVLGEFVHPRHSSVWTATLLEALGAPRAWRRSPPARP